jgi:glutamine synthetase
MTDEEDMGEPILVTTESFLAQKASPAAIGLTIELICSVYSPDGEPFEFLPRELAERLAGHHREGEDLETLLIEHREEISAFFDIQTNGHWVPSSQFFIMPGACSEAKATE